MRLMAIGMLLAVQGCSQPVVVARPVQPSSIAYYKADPTGKVGQPVRVVARVMVPSGAYGGSALKAVVDEAAKAVTLTATIKDLSEPGMAYGQAVGYEDAEARFVPRSAGTYKVNAKLVPDDWNGPRDFSHLQPPFDAENRSSSQELAVWQEVTITE